MNMLITKRISWHMLYIDLYGVIAMINLMRKTNIFRYTLIKLMVYEVGKSYVINGFRLRKYSWR